MAEKRKAKKRKEEFAKEEPEKPAKEEYTIAAWLRKNVPTKKTKFLNHNVEYFTAVKAVDALLASHWAEAKEGEEPMFPARTDVVEFLDTMLRHKFFHRAKKVPVSEAELKAKQKKKDGKKKPEEEGKKKEEEAKKKEEEGKKKEDAESSHAENTAGAADIKEGCKAKRRKIRLDMHMEQVFVDGLDAYVWIYDPIPVYYWFAGALLVLGAIGICLFPLWPPSVRKGVYYLSVAAAGFLIFIIGLAIMRVVVFCLVWGATFGAHHFWLFPNLIEDVGFLASFWPIYQYEYKGGGGKKKKKDKDSDNEEDNRDDDEEDKETDDKQSEPPVEQAEESESESESSQKSQTGRDFEMVDPAEVEAES